MDKLRNKKTREKFVKNTKLISYIGYSLGLLLILLDILIISIFGLESIRNDSIISTYFVVFSINSFALIVFIIMFNIERLSYIKKAKVELKYERFKLHLNKFYNMVDKNDFNSAIYEFNKFLNVNASNQIDRISSNIAQGYLLGSAFNNINKLDDKSLKSIMERIKLIKKTIEL